MEDYRVTVDAENFHSTAQFGNLVQMCEVAIIYIGHDVEATAAVPMGKAWFFYQDEFTQADTLMNEIRNRTIEAPEKDRLKIRALKLAGDDEGLRAYVRGLTPPPSKRTPPPKMSLVNREGI